MDWEEKKATQLSMEDTASSPKTMDDSQQPPSFSLHFTEMAIEISTRSSHMKMDDFDHYKKNRENQLVVKDKIKESCVGMIFDTVDDLFKFYIKYGNEMGFPMKKRTSSKGDDGEVRWVTVACSRSDRTPSNSRNAFNVHLVTKSNCKAKLSSYMPQWKMIHEKEQLKMSSQEQDIDGVRGIL